MAKTTTYLLLLPVAISYLLLRTCTITDFRDYIKQSAFKFRFPQLWQVESAPKLRIISYDPFVAHIENFLSTSERNHLRRLAEPVLEKSLVVHRNGSQLESTSRTSSTAFLLKDDPVVVSVVERAAELQGLPDADDIDMQATSYQQGQQYKPHHDWFKEPPVRGLGRITNRFSTIFAILEADCEECGTRFPRIPMNWTEKDPRLCAFLDCSKPVLTSRNIPGSAIFWRNLDENGRGRNDTLHAGMPALNGTKIGVNIWTEVEVPPETMQIEPKD